MAIASSKKREVCQLGLRVTGLDEYFDVIIGADDVVKHKPDKETIVKAYEALGTSMSNTIYVGDSPSDVICARNAGVFSIALVSNELRRQELSDIKPNRLIDDMAEIESILQEDHPWTYNMM
jgi:phosphoglycolate phosphatase-like HAD superfamily hydrolase